MQHIKNICQARGPVVRGIAAGPCTAISLVFFPAKAILGSFGMGFLAIVVTAGLVATFEVVPTDP